jgi:Phage Tail Collar Domain/Collagen triple helix repeat (20 copies)
MSCCFVTQDELERNYMTSQQLLSHIANNENFIGSQGEQGEQGEQGLQGPMGEVGPIGPTGNTGATGPQGVPGDEGPPGSTGPQGEIGPTGNTGPQGASGIQGATGPPGPNIVGMIAMFPAIVTLPNWVQCNGQELNRTTHSELFGIIGTVYGAGNGTTTFNVPDLRGMFPVCINPSLAPFQVVGSTGGAASNSHYHPLARGAAQSNKNLLQYIFWDSVGENSNAASFGTVGSLSREPIVAKTNPTTVPTLPPFRVLEFYICYLPS